MTAIKSRQTLSAKNASLLALVVQQVALVLLIRHSRTRSEKAYLSSTAVVSAEVLKLILNFGLEVFFRKDGTFLKDTMHDMISNREAFHMAIPALLYVIQNNLLFVALGNLTVPVYQVTNQGKLLTTAFFSRCMLNKQISNVQYLSLFVLALGVATVQMSSIEFNHSSSSGQNQILGLMAVFFSCCTSGAAGVYFEKTLKSSSEMSVYLRNCQLSLFSIVLALFPVIFNDLGTIQQSGFFQGYDAVVIGVIACQAMTGLIVGLVMKHADSILKGFSTSVAVVVATLLSVFIWGSKVDGWFVLGAGMVICAIRLYAAYPAPVDSIEPSEHMQSTKRRSKRLQILSPMICGAMVVTFQVYRAANIIPRPSTTASEYLDPKPQSYLHSADHLQCAIRKNVSEYLPYISWDDEGSRTDRWEHCLRFQCTNNEKICDNREATNYDGSEPPCCVHILRDMAREFDRVMCHLGLEYFPAFGMLLGLVRADKFIPWTIDNDYIMSEEMLAAMQKLWPEAEHLQHGLGFHFDQVYRLCATPSFAEGKLAKHWQVNETSSWYADSTYPFADIFSAKQLNATHIMDQRECYHEVSDLRPVVRKPVYGGTFYQQTPQAADRVLETFFGPNWRTPDARKKSHGGTHCGRRRAMQKQRAKKRAARQKANKANKKLQKI